MASPRAPRIELLESSSRRISGLDSETFAKLLASEKEALGRRSAEIVVIPPVKKSWKRRRSSLGGLRGSIEISMVPETFRRISGRSEGPGYIRFDLLKSSFETVGIYFRQGDGFDRAQGIFVSRLEMGCPAETMGLHVGDEVVEVNGINVTNGDIEWVEMLMKVVHIVVLKVRKQSLTIPDFTTIAECNGDLLPAIINQPKPEKLISSEEMTAFALRTLSDAEEIMAEDLIEETDEIGVTCFVDEGTQHSEKDGVNLRAWQEEVAAAAVATEKMSVLPDYYGEFVAAELSLIGNEDDNHARHVQLKKDETRANTIANRSSYTCAIDEFSPLVPQRGEKRRSVQFEIPKDDNMPLKTVGNIENGLDSPTAQPTRPTLRDSSVANRLDFLLEHVSRVSQFHGKDNVDTDPLTMPTNVPLRDNLSLNDYSELEPPPSPSRKTEFCARSQGLQDTYGTTKVISIDRGEGEEGIGLCFTGGVDSNLGAIFVREVIPGGIADLDGRVWEGDRILSVNYQDTDKMTKSEFVNILQSSSDDLVSLGIMRIGPTQWKSIQKSSQNVKKTSLEDHQALEFNDLIDRSGTKNIQLNDTTINQLSTHIKGREVQHRLPYPVHRSARVVMSDNNDDSDSVVDHGYVTGLNDLHEPHLDTSRPQLKLYAERFKTKKKDGDIQVLIDQSLVDSMSAIDLAYSDDNSAELAYIDKFKNQNKRMTGTKSKIVEDNGDTKLGQLRVANGRRRRLPKLPS